MSSRLSLSSILLGLGFCLSSLSLSLSSLPHHFSDTLPPLSTTLPSTITTISHPMIPLSNWYPPVFSSSPSPSDPTDIIPLPTNVWWSNLAVGSTRQTSFITPLAVQMFPCSGAHTPSTSTCGVTLSLPNYHFDSTIVQNSFIPSWTIKYSGDISSPLPHSVSYHDSHVAIVEIHNNNNTIMSVPLVRGDPYLTIEYVDPHVQPLLSTIHAILQIQFFCSDQDGVVVTDPTDNGLSCQVAEGGSTLGKGIMMGLNDGSSWFVFVSDSVMIHWKNRGEVGVEFVNTENYRNGGERVIRMAAAGEGLSAQENFIALSKFATQYAISVDKKMDFTTVPNMIDVHYLFQTKSFPTYPNQNPLLLLTSLPHHRDVILSNNGEVTLIPSIKYLNVKGSMEGVVGNLWTLRYPVVEKLFDYDNAVDHSVLPSNYQQILNDDIDTKTNQLKGSRDSYGTGKLLAGLSRLLYTQYLYDPNTSSPSYQTGLTELLSSLSEWFAFKNANPLLYDRTYGGIVTHDGIENSGADYGNGWYNDHHFHWGYFIYTAAMMGKISEVNANNHTNPLSPYHDTIVSLIRDIANPSALDPYFPPFRFFDFFDGHSWASGLFEFGDGKNLESSTESLNCWYGIKLYGDMVGDENIQNIGNLLLAMEMVSVKKYWHSEGETSTLSPLPSLLVSDSDNDNGNVYPPVFSSALMVGQIWGGKAVEATWFASGFLYIHGINWIPFTPLTEIVLSNREYAKSSVDLVMKTIGNNTPTATDEWMGFVYGVMGIGDSVGAREKMMELKAFDNGNSLSNMLWWLATRKTE